MKTFWIESVVDRNSDKAGFPNPHEYLLAKTKEFERYSGVKWSVSPQHGGYQFHAIDDGVPAEGAGSVVQAALRAAWRDTRSPTGYATYVDVHEAAGLSLRLIMGVVKWMEKRGLARRTVNRMGKGFAFKLTEAI